MLNIGFLVFPSFNILDLSGPLAAFDVPRRELRPAPYRLTAYSEHGGPVVSSCGVSVNTVPLGRGEIDTFITVGGTGAVAASRSPSMIALVRRTAPRARRVASVCSGTFLLAEAGLLEGRRVTTHWEYACALQQAFPGVKMECDQIYVRDGSIWTSGGVTAGIDLALALIEDDVGLEAAQRTARVLVVYHRRMGGQSQFSAMLEMEPATDRVRRALSYAREHLHQPLNVERLAAGPGGRAAANGGRAHPGHRDHGLDRDHRTPRRILERGANAPRVREALWTAAAGGPARRESVMS